MHRRSRRFFSGRSALLLGIVLTTPAFAWDGVISGTVDNYQVVIGQAGNFDFRVTLTGSPVLCTGGTNWAYALEGEANYKALVAAVMVAKAQGTSLTLYTTRDAYNSCHIGHVVVR